MSIDPSTQEVACPVIDETHIPVPHFPYNKVWRHPLFPGLFEYVRTIACDGSLDQGGVKRFLNALQPAEECEAHLQAQAATRVVATKEGKEVKVETNYLAANGDEGEDRMVVEAVSWAKLGDVLEKAGDAGRVGRKTVWGRWKSVAEVKAAEESEADKDKHKEKRSVETVADVSEDDNDIGKADLDVNEDHGDQKHDPAASSKAPADKDLILCTVLDGHGGAYVVDCVQKGAHAALAVGLATNPAALEGDEAAITQIIKDVYTTISQDIAAASLSVLTHTQTSAASTILPHLPSVASLQLAALERGGACVATALIDLRGGKVYIAHAGDVRVLGIWTDDQGGERAEVLTEDHNGVNEAEVARVKAAHPTDPNAMVKYKDEQYHRVLGWIMVSRTMGDVDFNRTEAVKQQMLAEGVHKLSEIPNPLIDPPYLTWEPTVTVRNLKKGVDGEKLETILMASDGLWDKMTDEEAARALIAHAQLKARAKAKIEIDPAVDIDVAPAGAVEPTGIPASTLTAQHPFPLSGPHTVPPSAFACAAAEAAQHPDVLNRTWTFRDPSNAATHLLRNALGDGDELQEREMLSLKYGTRLLRDDTSVMVIHLDQ